MGLAGGLLPSPSALLVLLGAVALGHAVVRGRAGGRLRSRHGRHPRRRRPGRHAAARTGRAAAAQPPGVAVRPAAADRAAPHGGRSRAARLRAGLARVRRNRPASDRRTPGERSRRRRAEADRQSVRLAEQAASWSASAPPSRPSGSRTRQSSCRAGRLTPGPSRGCCPPSGVGLQRASDVVSERRGCPHRSPREHVLAAAVAVQATFDELGTPLHEVTFVVVDLETTGGSPQSCEITEIGAVKVRGGERLGEFQTLVNPGVADPAVHLGAHRHQRRDGRRRPAAGRPRCRRSSSSPGATRCWSRTTRRSTSASSRRPARRPGTSGRATGCSTPRGSPARSSPATRRPTASCPAWPGSSGPAPPPTTARCPTRAPPSTCCTACSSGSATSASARSTSCRPSRPGSRPQQRAKRHLAEALPHAAGRLPVRRRARRGALRRQGQGPAIAGSAPTSPPARPAAGWPRWSASPPWSRRSCAPPRSRPRSASCA